MLKINEIKQFVNEDKTSVKKQLARKGLEYYNGRHDIEDYKVYFYDDEGLLREDHTKANERISHPFFTELVDQCTQYMLSGKESFMKSDDSTLQGYLDAYFDDEFKMELNDLLTYSSVEGFSYLYRYMGADNKSHFQFADGLDVVEVPAKYSSDGKDYVIYRYYWKTEKALREEALALLHVFGLDGEAETLSSSLPYGKQRKLEIARALATKPKLLLLDEPAAGMNPHETGELMETIRFIRDRFDMTILLIEHDLKLVSGICECVTVLNFGTTLAQGRVDEVLKNPDVVTAYLGE